MRTLDIIPCDPPVWARGGHAQTLLGHLLPSPRLRQRGERIEVPLPDGDRLVAYFRAGTAPVTTYLFHGLTGDVSSSYMERTAQVAQSLGHSVWLVNHRGCGDGEHLARQPYHSGRGEDLAEVIALGRAKEPKHRHVAVGFSLSGSALLNLVTGRRGTCPPDQAITVNAPIDLAAASEKLRRGANRIYDRNFVSGLQRLVRQRKKLGLLDGDEPRLPRGACVMDFDDAFTAPQSGFASGQQYYAECSTYRYLERIVVPTVLLTAADDPFVPVETYRAAKLSPATRLHIEPFGGHLGYLSRTPTPLGTRRWLDYALTRVFSGS